MKTLAMALSALPPELVDVVKDVRVSEDGREAGIGAETVRGDTPRQVASELGVVMYHLVHVGRDEPAKSRPRTLRDPGLDRALAEATPQLTTRASATVMRPPVDAEPILLATLEGVRVLVPREAVAGPLPEVFPARVRVRTPATRPALSPGFFLADSSAGPGVGADTLRVYIGLEHPDAAPAAWHTVLSTLEGQDLPYRAKVSSSPRLYPRRDALVIYLKSPAWHVVPELARAVTGLAGLGTEVSPFAHRIAAGVAIAWEPQDPRPVGRGLSFGEHRSRVLAEALVRHAIRADGVGAAETIAESFVNASIDPLLPARNLASPPLPSVGLG